MSSEKLTGTTVLIVEDDPLLGRQISAHLQGSGAQVTVVGTLGEARAQLDSDRTFDVALLDINLPDGLGTTLLEIEGFCAQTAVIVMTAQGGVESAVAAMKRGAADYLHKPFELVELPLVIERARAARRQVRIEQHRQDAEETGAFFFGAGLKAVANQIERIIAADERLGERLPPVLIEGETGTGKTTIARRLHDLGPRRARAFIDINCSALPDHLIESELFGHERGAFTDARTARMGLFEAADGGTLFLDELPSLPLSAQAKVLTAIETQRIRRLGSNKAVEVDVRVIAATNRDLKEAVAQGKFREDLYHRLDLYRVSIPPLCERGEDIIKLAELILTRVCQRHRAKPRTISAEGRRRLLSYRWPGNVRELAHEIERAIVFEDAPVLEFGRLTPLPSPAADANLSSSSVTNDWFNEQFTFPAEGFSLEAAIDRMTQHALKQSGGNVSAAARLLGVTRDFLRYRLAKVAESESMRPDSDQNG